MRSALTNLERPRANAPIPDLRRLRAFVVVAEELHFRRAAERLVMAQSPLSRIIKSLEQDIGVPLFIRNRRNVWLTEAGAALLGEARELMQRADLAIYRVRRLRGEPREQDGGTE
jgi:DNA-binding transcriptional LysR family regulator